MRGGAPLLCAILGLGGSALGGPQQNYVLYCMGCHGAEAQGVPGRIPPLAGTLNRYMRSAEGRNYVLRVPGAANTVLGDADLAGVLNWLALTYAAPGDPPVAPFSPDEVSRVRHVPLADVQATRREVVRNLALSGPAPAPEY